MSKNKACLHVYVTGRVQGVYFRSNTRDKAKAFNLTGWVKNLPDGRVEVMACGETRDLNALLEWLHQGPANAKVTHIDSETQPFSEFVDFSITR